ncbi:uncharacterized protein L969DRAFT_50553 [Mixia osmundae IAM 14324]|uniref:Serine aminopeptidase S33 domain-containing protein n=1 Tax=Mixia osmundae (strain CBS 9802 / IAM 14324 / JCM 22182 / KY 12970) TaxID=764103 RepID=G7E6Q7_MIXOS|nr:uncharacterized protein L969DRAFT_50553 [Mixia osmundae IAM 14324]KEI39101.1 hypothetical protein L969DRAFT_50553 [Mixia osmundae IAM 14324]GAA98517.1 hypothetical protein E5Q_05203 [Mixia osmundae IAM 14324]
MIAFQRKIIYMPGVPLGARREPFDPASPDLEGLRSELVTVAHSKDRFKLRGILVETENRSPSAQHDMVIVYLQGNASNPLRRAPVFSSLLLGRTRWRDETMHLRILAVAPRGFWLSTSPTIGGGPTQPGLVQDYISVVLYAKRRWPEARVVVHGHSIGAAAALQVALTESIDGLVLESTFTSMLDLVRAFYHSKWLPYHYLGRFVLDKFDSLNAIARLPSDMPLLLIESGNDELIPGGMLSTLASASSAQTTLITVPKALHDTGYMRSEWRDAIHKHLSTCKPV